MCVCGEGRACVHTCSHVCVYVCVCVCVCVSGGSVRKNKCQTEGGLPTPPTMSLTTGFLDSWMCQEQSSRLRIGLLLRSTSRLRLEEGFLHCQMAPIPGPVLACSYWSCLPGLGLTGDRPHCPGKLISGTGPCRAEQGRRVMPQLCLHRLLRVSSWPHCQAVIVSGVSLRGLKTLCSWLLTQKLIGKRAVTSV